MVNKEDLAYTAGFFDGEGCVTIYRNVEGNSYVLNVAVYNTNLDILLQLRDWFGGYIVDNPQRPKCKQSYTWRLGAIKAYVFLETIRPYVRVKIKQVGLALAFKKIQDSERIGKSHPRSPEDNELLELIHWKMKEFNARGTKEVLNANNS